MIGIIARIAVKPVRLAIAAEAVIIAGPFDNLDILQPVIGRPVAQLNPDKAEVVETED